VLTNTSDDLVDEPVRERVFDVMMRRIDALLRTRQALRRNLGGDARRTLSRLRP
jgi:hypothetical protein